jgi:tetratricopeptide (TPR) repeat protein
MSKTEWFRRTTWSDADREDFNARLKRCRGAGSKAQYLRVQAVHLAEAGRHAAAIELLDRSLAEFPDNLHLAQAHTQKAGSLAKLGRVDSAIEQYRRALQAERDFPNVRTNAWLDFGWLVVEKQLESLYGEAAQVLREFRQESDLKFPASEYRYFVIQALLADARNERERASGFAKQALAEATRVHSGLRYHPALGLVGPERATFEERISSLAAG